MKYQEMIDTVAKIARAYKKYNKVDDYQSARKHLAILLEKQYRFYDLDHDTEMVESDVEWLLA